MLERNVILVKYAVVVIAEQRVLPVRFFVTVSVSSQKVTGIIAVRVAIVRMRTLVRLVRKV